MKTTKLWMKNVYVDFNILLIEVSTSFKHQTTERLNKKKYENVFPFLLYATVGKMFSYYFLENKGEEDLSFLF